MSIRLRLTLIYTAILALLLLLVSLMLYFSQTRMMSKGDQFFLMSTANRVSESWPAAPPGDDNQPAYGRRREAYVQIRRQNGDLIQADPNLGGLVLPLVKEGQPVVSSDETWFETVFLNDEDFLIYNQPFNDEDGTATIIQVAISLTRQEQFLGDMRNILITGSVVILMLVFGVSWLLAGLALRPIHRITQTAQAIGAERDFSRRVDYTGPNDEIGQLATTFNKMLTELQAGFMQVEETLQAQRRFVADASHELRTPLTTLRGNISLLQRDPPINPEDRADVLSDMVDETERLMRLVSELLILARADAGRPLPQEAVALKPLIEDVYQQVKLLAPQRTIICSAPIEATLLGNNDALKQVLLVLLDNALKHTPPEAAITLTSATQNGHVTIQVSDTGPGIEAAQLPYIFDRFYRGDTARSSPGAGLGLTIAQELTQAHHGVITVESQKGQGTTFTLTFPHGFLIETEKE